MNPRILPWKKFEATDDVRRFVREERRRTQLTAKPIRRRRKNQTRPLTAHFVPAWWPYSTNLQGLERAAEVIAALTVLQLVPLVEGRDIQRGLREEITRAVG